MRTRLEAERLYGRRKGGRLRLGLRLVFVLTSVVFAVATRPTVRGQAGRPAPNTAVMPFDVTEKSIEDLQRAMQTGEVTSRQLVDIYLTRIVAYDQQGPALNAIATLNPRARETAIALDASPFLAPVPHRGTRNEPAHVLRVAEAIAKMRDTTFEAVGEATRRNFARLFNP